MQIVDIEPPVMGNCSKQVVVDTHTISLQYKFAKNNNNNNNNNKTIVLLHTPEAKFIRDTGALRIIPDSFSLEGLARETTTIVH